MLSEKLKRHIVIAIGSFLLGFVLIFVPESSIFGTFLIGFSVGLGLSIIERIKKAKGS